MGLEGLGAWLVVFSCVTIVCSVISLLLPPLVGSRRRRNVRARVKFGGGGASGKQVGMGPDKVVICGAGLHGASLAYYLTQMGHKDVTVIEREKVAAGASGKGGGFLARDWGSGPTTQVRTIPPPISSQLCHAGALHVHVRQRAA